MTRETESGLPVEPVYRPGQPADFDPAAQLGEPGEYPYTRGVYPAMYTARPWTMRQYSGFSTAEDSNRRYHQLIEAGGTGLSVAFDLPTQMGYDSDAPAARGEVGKVGVAIDSVEDMEVLLGGIPLDSVSTSKTISISGYHMAEAGATPAQEIAFTLANAKEYVRAAIASGQAVDDFAPRLSFFFVARTTLLEEVAKFRAGRRLWARIMREEFGAANPRSQMLRFHTQTAGVQLTAQQPEVNLARVTVQALAAVLGGTQSLHTNAYDEAIALPTEKAARLALRTQQVLAHETDLTSTADPLAGSYAVESMTASIRDEAAEMIGRVEEMGGAVAAIEQGFQKAEIERSAYQVARQIDAGERVVVGVNRFTTGADESYAPLRVDPVIERQQAERLGELRRRRDAAAVRRGLDAIRDSAAGHDNVLYPLREALAARATVGEVCDAMRDVWGVYQPADVG